MFSKMFFVLILQCFQKCFLYCNVRPKTFSCRVLHVGRLSVLMDSDENNLKTISKFKFACFPAEFNSHRGKLFTLCSNILSCSNTIPKLNPFLKMLFRFFQFLQVTAFLAPETEVTVFCCECRKSQHTHFEICE